MGIGKSSCGKGQALFTRSHSSLRPFIFEACSYCSHRTVSILKQFTIVFTQGHLGRPVFKFYVSSQAISTATRPDSRPKPSKVFKSETGLGVYTRAYIDFP